jgi:sugar lactone lactonase YvrE
VRKATAATGVISTVAGSYAGSGSFGGGYSGDGGPATSAQLYWPAAVTLDSAGNLYIADTYNAAIRKVTSSSGIITTVAGIGDTFSCIALAGDGGPATNAGLCYPLGISADGAGNLYIADSGFSRIRLATVTALPPTVATAAPTLTVSAGTYASPQTVTIGDATPGASIYLTTDGTPPSTLSSGYNGPIKVSGNVTIRAIAVAPGHLTSTPVSAAYTITSPPAKVINTIAGTGVSGLAGTGGPAKSAQMGQISALAIDGVGDLFFTDVTNSVVWGVAAATGNISIVAGNGTAGFSGDGGPATSAQLNSPNGIAVDGTGNIYISDSNNSVVREVVASTGLIKTFAGTPGQFGYPGHIGDGGPASSAYLNGPHGVALDAAGNLYIADSYNNEVRVVSATTGIITSFAGNGSYYFSCEGGQATSASLGQPNTLAFDTAGNLYIASYTMGRVCKVTAATGILTTVAGNGNRYGTSGDGGPALSAEIYPLGLALDTSGNIYISNWTGSIREVAVSTGIINKIVGNGYPGYSGDGGSAAAAQLQLPQGIAVDASGNLYIADSGNYRVREVSPPAPTATPVISPAAGTYTSVQMATITDSSKGAIIYYTTDGSPPSNTSSVYSSPIAISATTILQAIAIAPGSAKSAAASATYTIIPIGTAAATVTLTPSATTVTNEQPVSVAVSVAGASGQSAQTTGPTGSVTLSGGSYSAEQALSSGAATFSIPAGALSEGANRLTANYSGDMNYAAAGGTITVTVTPVLLAAPNPPPVAPGSSTSTTATFSAGSTYSGTMNLTCTLTASPTGARSLPTCSLNPASVTIATGGSASTVVTVKTTAASSSSALVSPGRQAWKALSGGGALALACLFVVPSWRRRKALMMVALFGIAVAGFIGCGGGGSSSTTPPPTTPATIAGTYTFSVVGTDSSNTKITASTNVTVKVQ